MSSTFESTVAGDSTLVLQDTIVMGAPSPRAAPGPALAAGTLLGEFEIVRLIGEGGFGIVYLAVDRSLQREVAIKEFFPPSVATRESAGDRVVTLSPQHRETFEAGLRSFLNEARLLARFDHPSLVKVLRFWEANGTAYMAMPHYRGPTLRHNLLAAESRPGESDLLGWLHPLLDAIEVLHQARCFHRDIAPDNILLTDRGPVLLDFGAARHVIGGMTQALTVVLKPSFAPIEQYGDSTSVGQGPWTDLYALASVLHFAITGKAPVPSVERVLFDELVPLSQAAKGRYSAALLAAIDASLALRPQDRPQDVAAFRRLLLCTEEPVESIDLHLPFEDQPQEPETPEPATESLAMPDIWATAPAPLTVEAPVTELPMAPQPSPTQWSSQPIEAPTGVGNAPAAAPARRRPLTLGVAAAAALLVIGVALREHVLPSAGAPRATASTLRPPLIGPPQVQAQPLPGVPPEPTASGPATPAARAADIAPAPTPSQKPALPAAAQKRGDESAARGRSTARAVATPHEAGGVGEAASAAMPKPHPAAVPPIEAGPPEASRCAEILEKASLGALAADDAATLKKECR